MPSDRPLLSVVIPTRERPSTLRHAIQSALTQNSASYEVLVCDNASEDNTRAVVEGFTDPRLRYIRASRRLSMSDNWEFALTHTNGRYVLFIGDDDAVLPYGVDRLLALFSEQPSRVYMWTPPTYTWPLEGRAAEATYLPRHPRTHRMDLLRMARTVIRHGGWRYYRLPGAYHAAVERDVLTRIGAEAGRVFRSTQPDLFTSMSVPAITPTALHTGRPVTANGRSAWSNASALVSPAGAAALERYIREYGEYALHPTLCPELPLRANFVLDAFLIAMDAFPRAYSGVPFNHEAALAFLCKWGLLTQQTVLSHAAALRLRHDFRTPKFLMWVSMFRMVTARRRILDRLSVTTGPFRSRVPSDITAFAEMYVQSIGQDDRADG